MEAATQLVGRQVGDFRLIEEIGHGGMGAAYRAAQITLHREAIVKVLAATDVSEEAKVRFLREARLASRLDHPYAAHVYAFGAEPDGRLWIAMELVRGVPLDRMIADQGPMPLARFVPLFDRLCEVVFSAHEQGIIHRDIKPANVMVVRRAGRLLPKLLDFGIARGTGLDMTETAATTPILDTALADGTRSITMRGNVVGSPEYMAPEQWVDATKATARTDLYALAITAYEMLTARRPFTGRTVLAIARAHARAAVPTVAPDLPAELDRVFARALAKREAQRYDNVLELGAAIREVARGTSTVGPSLDLDEVVRDTFIQSGPQPLAEALVELSVTRAPQAAWDAGWKVVTVLTRVLGTIALAVRARIGERKLPAELAIRVRTLVERGLDLEGWEALIAALVEPFAARPQAYPVPELVETKDLFGELLALRRSTEAIDAEAVQALLVELGKTLRACAFLTDYRWVAATSGGEAWMGPRRHPREPTPIAAKTGVWLVDRDGAAIVELSPFAHATPPAPGADDELFLLDGPAKRGARAVAWPREFERFDDELLAFIDRSLAPVVATESADHDEATPYRGLASFGPNDAAMFFGREQEIEAVVNRLRVQPMIAVVGPSGVGKSSFVHAGVLASLPESWQPITFRPGVSPLTAVESRFVAAGIATAGLADEIRRDPAALGRVLDDAARHQGTKIVVVVDQLEEMFTQCRDADTRDLFARALAGIGGSTCLIATLRDDFLVRAAELPVFGARIANSLEIVTLPDPSALRRIVVEPLRRIGYTFETEAMPDDMVASVREHPGALALLSFAASKLWELRDRGFRHIPKRAYEALGGVAGALARHAEDTLSALPESDHALVRELFRHLVTSEGTRAVLRRVEAIQLLGKGPGAERVIETLLERRLLVSYEGDGKADWIEVIHEALLSAWPRLVGWQREDAEGARLRDQLRSAARQWGERGKPKGLLWRGEALVEYRLWRSRHAAALTDLELEFATSSMDDEARSRRWRRAALAAVVIGLAIGVVVLQRANRTAERNADESRRVALALLVEEGRAAFVANRPQDAMVYLAEAYKRGADDRNLPFLLGVTGRVLGDDNVTLRGHTAGVKSAFPTTDGARIVSAGLDGSVRIWTTATGQLEHQFTATGAVQFSIAQVIAGNGIVTWGDKELPAVWDAATGLRRFTIGKMVGAVAEATADGATIATVDEVSVRTWRSSDGSPIHELVIALPQPPNIHVAGQRYVVTTDHGVAVGSLDLTSPPTVVAPLTTRPRVFFGGGGTRIVTIDEDTNEVRVWDVDHPGDSKLLTGHAGDVLVAQISPDGTRVVTTSMDHSAKLWNASTGTMIASLDGHEGYVLPATWSADGRLVATGSVDRTARVWDGHTGTPIAVFYGHTDVVYRVAFDASDRHLVTSSFDGTARVFDTASSNREIDLHHDGPVALAFDGSGHRVVATSHDGSAWVVDVETRAIVAAFPGEPLTKSARLDELGMRTCGDIDAAGTTIVVAHGKEARVITLADRDHPVVLGPLTARVTCARFAPGGAVVVGAADGSVSIWRDGRRQQTLALHTGIVTDLSVDPRTGRIATASEDGTVKVIEAGGTAASQMFTSNNGSINGVALSHDGSRIATAGQDTVASVYVLATHALQTASHSFSDLEAVAFTPDDLRIGVANTEGTVGVFDSATGLLLARYAPGGWVTGLAFSSRGDLLATADDRGHIRIWSVASETRSPSEISRVVACRVPLELVDTRLIARTVTQCGSH